ncbi:MAG: hypothetical protein WC661_14520 [Opitutaceae bacterium]|jgi:hypothetical protein
MTRVFTLLAYLASLALLGVLIYWSSGWSHINCWTREINIATGHQRYTRYWFWCVTERQIKSTWISESLGSLNTTPDSEADWRLVVTLSPGTHHSPHYRFHSALYDIQKTESLLEIVDASPAIRTQLAKNALWLWQQFQSDDEAGRFLMEVLTIKNVFDRAHLDAADIPQLKDWLTAQRSQVAAQNNSESYLQRLDDALTSLKSTPSP